MIEGHGDDAYKYKAIKINFSSNVYNHVDHSGLHQHLFQQMESIRTYPEPEPYSLEKVLAERFHLSSEEVCVTNGATEAIYLIAQTFRNQISAILMPTFSEYADACRLHGHKVVPIYNLNRLPDRGRLIWLCNPNNPTGILINDRLLERIIKECDRNGVRIFLDECFLDFTGKEDELSYVKNILRYRGLFVLKAFTKMYAIPGIRLGYGITYDKELIDKMYDAGQPWNVSVLAQNAGIAALDEDKFAADTVSLISKEREFICTNFQKMNIKYWESDANYIFFMHKKGLKEELLNRGILIRDCSNYKNLTDGYYRIAIKSHKDNVKLIDALADIDIN